VKVTFQNYYGQEAQKAYKTNSQIGVYERCTLLWWHQYQECDYKPDRDFTHFTVGHFFEDALLDGYDKALETLAFEHPTCFRDVTIDQIRETLESYPDIKQVQVQFPELFVSRGERKGQLKASFKVTDAMRVGFPSVFAQQGPLKAEFNIQPMLDAVNGQPYVKMYLQGERDCVIKGVINEVPCMGLCDLLDHENKRIVDIKTTQDIEKQEWVDSLGRRAPFYEKWNYWRQMAFYQELVMQMTGERYECYLVVVDKPTRSRRICKATVIDMNEPKRMAWELAKARLSLFGMSQGVINRQCGDCEVCRERVKISAPVKAIDYRQVGANE